MSLKSEYQLVEKPLLRDLPSLVFESMQKYGDRPFLIDSSTGKQYSFHDSYVACRKIGYSLYHNYGLRKGDVVMIVSKNCPEYVLFSHGAASIGAVLTMVNQLSTADELVSYLGLSQPKLIFTSQEVCEKVRQAIKACGQIKDIVVLGQAPGCISYTNLLDTDVHDFPSVTFDPKNDTFFTPYSSGTTGKPKGVELTHWNLIYNNRQSTAPGFDILSPNSREVVLIYLPLYHMFGATLSVGSMLGGHTAIIMPSYDLKTFINLVKTYKVTVLPMVPPTVVQITKNPAVLASDFASVKTFLYGAAPLGDELEQEFSHKFPKQELRQAYGMTELSTFVTCVPRGIPLRPGTVGKLVPDTEMKIIDITDGSIVGVNKTGELWIRGPQIMKGYLQNKKATAEIMDTAGFLKTGDIGSYDEEGFVYVVDRVKELIKFKGFQVAPAELEGLLLTHPGIVDSAVVGVPDETAGELPRAYVVLRPGHRISETDIIEFVAKRVSPHKKLRGGVRFVQAIPKSGSGKILRRALKDKAREERKMKAKI